MNKINTPKSFVLFFLKGFEAKYALLMLMIVIIGIVPSIDSIILKNIINILENHDHKTFSILFKWAIFYAIWNETINITYRLYDYIYLCLFPQLKGKVIKYFYDYIQKQSHTFFQQQLAGNLSDRILEAARAFEDFLHGASDKIVKKLIAIMGALITTCYINKFFAGIFAIWIIIVYTISFFVSPIIKKFSRNLAASRSEIGGKIIDCIHNILSVRMFNGYDQELLYLEKPVQNFITSDIALHKSMLIIRYFLGLASSAAVFGVMYYLSKLYSHNQITIGDFVLVLYLCHTISKEIWELTEEAGDVFENYGAFEQFTRLLSSYIVQDIKDAKELKISNCEIIFEKVSFHYGTNPLFIDQSVVIPGKQKVALIGKSGSGKTSFISLITRLHDLHRGQIFIDGQDISHVTQSSLRNAISFIPQEPTLFQRSIKDNIRYGKPDATDEEIIDAAQKAHIHEAIIYMPDGYETMCSEKGQNLSGGQKQRIIIARAILKKAPILILDEATSSLDPITEKLIRQSLNFLMQDKTVILIAHKLSSVVSMDRILVFKKGKIIQDGKHEDLIKQEGLYQNLWTSHTEDLIL